MSLCLLWGRGCDVFGVYSGANLGQNYLCATFQQLLARLEVRCI